MAADPCFGQAAILDSENESSDLVLGYASTGCFGVGYGHELAVLCGAVLLVAGGVVDLGVQVYPY